MRENKKNGSNLIFYI